MSDNVISVENISKRYIIGHQQDSRDGLRHLIEDAVRNPLRWLSRSRAIRKQSREEFWALKDVSFNINHGDVVGIIGRNGAGKSTLLKILSRITDPTEGRIRIKGRVASLLEVGTGFHQELSGRENIFLNGAILGMSRAEIKRKFDEIVAFSEIARFLDTPVKRYSSGMYVRLAFAVAAHLDPEILIVDEVLAVGDTAFQRKCLGKMGEVARGGRTILFVSHNMAAIRQLCTRGLFLSQGRTIDYGPITKVCEHYMTLGVSNSGFWQRQQPIPSGAGIYFEAVTITNALGQTVGHVDATTGFFVQMDVHSTATFEKGQIALRFTNQDGTVVFTTCNADMHDRLVPIHAGRHRFIAEIPGDLLAPGTYVLQIAAHVPEVRLFDAIDNTFGITVEDIGSLRQKFRDHRLGAVEPRLRWTMDSSPQERPHTEVCDVG